MSTNSEAEIQADREGALSAAELDHLLLRLEQNQLVSFVVRGQSMRPWVQSGDRVLLAPLRGARPRLGEVLLLRRGEALVLHRLIFHRGARLWLRGDALPYGDEPVSSGQVLARLVSLYRDGSWLHPARWRPLMLSLPLGAARQLKARCAAPLFDDHQASP